ncbi:Penicillin-binding protein 4* [Dyadobacter sp. CECT 9275]|uniref:Penicillin-binding protein 4 n=1 Tax=Dyadobacter helix TaxID=2822344 RepID=A0A916N6P8_9BACT|nr:serine hydrolase domain-containing protein [Dyadobacter sp. CECT 9275]CAG5010707.1 Penicillin-binding protein 4* [Dyadobacter sp. CECT 9275]
MDKKTRAISITLGWLVAVCNLASCNTNPGKTKPEKIDYLVERAAKEHTFIGNVLVMDKGQIIYKKGIGKANMALGLSNSDSTRFLLASLSKPFTAILILKLAEQGKLKLTDRLITYFKTVQSRKADEVTIHQLLTHTSGIKEFISEKRPFIESDLAQIRFNFEPGDDFEYSNSGYVLLAKMAEIASGKSYPDLVRELIFHPLQMSSSGVARLLDTIPNLAIGYQAAAQTQLVTIPYSLAVVDGAGSLYSTAGDLVKLNQGLNSDAILSKKMRELMVYPHVKEKFGYGWYLRERGGIWDVSYHKGDLPGYTSMLSRRNGFNQLIVLLANAGGLDLADLENDISRVLQAKE